MVAHFFPKSIISGRVRTLYVDTDFSPKDRVPQPSALIRPSSDLCTNLAYHLVLFGELARTVHYGRESGLRIKNLNVELSFHENILISDYDHLA